MKDYVYLFKKKKTDWKTIVLILIVMALVLIVGIIEKRDFVNGVL